MLEVQNKKLEKVITEKEYEILKQEKIAKEYVEQQDQLLFQVNDAN